MINWNVRVPDMRTHKAALRNARLNLRDAMTQDERSSRSAALVTHGLTNIDLLPGSIVSGFWPIRSEPLIAPLLEGLRQKGARLCLPVVLDRETIVFRDYPPGSPLVGTGFGTCGPGPEHAELDPDILLVPLSVFDGSGNRIGYGAGHYDRAIDLLVKKGHKPRLVGIAFDCQEVASVPAEPHDIGLDAIVTESGYRNFERQTGQI